MGRRRLALRNEFKNHTSVLPTIGVLIRFHWISFNLVITMLHFYSFEHCYSLYTCISTNTIAVNFAIKQHSIPTIRSFWPTVHSSPWFRGQPESSNFRSILCTHLIVYNCFLLIFARPTARIPLCIWHLAFRWARNSRQFRNQKKRNIINAHAAIASSAGHKIHICWKT